MIRHNDTMTHFLRVGLQRTRRYLGLDFTEFVLDPFGRDGFWAFDGVSRRAREGELAQDADGARRAEQHRVKVFLGDAVVLEQNARVRVHVRPRVLHFTGLGQDARDDFEELTDELKHGIVR